MMALKEPKVGTRKICSQPDHCSPFKALADIMLDRVSSYVAWANRCGSKTYLFGGLDTWWKSITKERYETKILGGSEEQAKLSYKAIDDFWRLTGLGPEYIKGRSLISRTEFKNGSEVSILTASTKSVRGPHPQRLLLDEVDEIEKEVFESALSQPVSKYGHGAVLGMFSTNHKVAGQMDAAIQNAIEKGIPVYKYCIWECIESCRDYECSTCQLSSLCPGKQVKEADGYYKISDFIQKLTTLSMQSIQRDWLCIKTGTTDLVYQEEWDEDVHLVNIPLNPHKPVTLSIDWGGAHPFSVGVWQVVPDVGHVRVAEIYESGTNQRILRAAKKAPWWKLIKKIIYDPARNDLATEWMDELTGKRVKFIKAQNDVDPGIEQVKNALRPLLGNPKIFINRACIATRTEFGAYSVHPKSKKIVPEFDHAMDEIRYYVMEEIAEGTGGSLATISHDVSPE